MYFCVYLRDVGNAEEYVTELRTFVKKCYCCVSEPIFDYFCNEMRTGKMKRYRIYLDNCCFNRPYDDQTHLLVQLETEAKLFIQRAILQNMFELGWSYILDYENSANPYHNRKQAIANWRQIAVVDINVSETLVKRGNEIMLKGINKKDALHIACAIEAKCDYFLTTDKKLLRTAFDGIIVTSPIDFIKILEI